MFYIRWLRTFYGLVAELVYTVTHASQETLQEFVLFNLFSAKWISQIRVALFALQLCANFSICLLVIILESLNVEQKMFDHALKLKSNYFS